MRVLVIGSGGREHALAWRIGCSPSAGQVFIAPGNPGTAQCGVNVDLDPGDFSKMVRFAKSSGIDLVVVGPENPLASGIADHLRGAGITTFGPGKDGAMLEASKTFAKEFMARHRIPHPEFRSFDSPDAARNYVSGTQGPWVIKADGLAFGKGVAIVADAGEAHEVLGDLFSGKAHGAAGKRVVIEEFLTGQEISAMALCDGKNLLPLPLAKDHKRAFEGDLGPMTGGMGAISPVPFVDAPLKRLIREQIFERTLAGLLKDGIEFRGLLYAGLMLTALGPKVLEYNVRFGDPETQCVLPRLSGDFCSLLWACARGALDRANGKSDDLYWVKPDACVSVVLTSEGYPGAYQKGAPITFQSPREFRETDGQVILFHGGTSLKDGRLVTSGGRVVAVTATASTLKGAAQRAYGAADRVLFSGKRFRSDIGKL